MKRGFTTSTACTWARARSTSRTPTPRPRRLALRVPGLRGRARRIDRPHRRTQDDLRTAAAKRFDADHRLARVRRLLVHSGLRGRLLRRVAHGAGRHAQTELPQTELRGGRDLAGAQARGARAGDGLTDVSTWKRRVEERKENDSERQEGHEEKRRFGRGWSTSRWITCGKTAIFSRNKIFQSTEETT